MPKVSVIMPAYNAERYIGEAVESVLAQTWQDWELIIVDDGSVDGTSRILERFSDARIKKLRQPNSGEGAARNAGLDAASGELIALLDADDLYFPNALADFVAYMNTHPDIGVAYSNGIICDANRTPLMTLTEHRPGIYEGRVLEQIVLSGSVVTVPSCTVTRRLLIESNRIRFDTEQALGADRLFWIALARLASFGYLDKLTCMYRIHDSSVSRRVPREERREQVARMRCKIIKSDWFCELSQEARVQFFLDLLINVLRGCPQRQREVMGSAPFLQLPAVEQARVYRLVASSYLLRGEEQQFARRCLEQSVALHPGDRKSQVLLKVLGASPSFCSLGLRVWRRGHDAGTCLRTVGRRKPRPVPAALRESL
jgi:hypothetical protein